MTIYLLICDISAAAIVIFIVVTSAANRICLNENNNVNKSVTNGCNLLNSDG